MKRVVVPLLLAVLAGCASQPHTGDNAGWATSNHSYSIYGKLEKTNSGYRFTEYAEDYTKNEPWVRLSDMRPMWNIETEHCLGGLAAKEDVICKSQNELLFRSKKLDFTPRKTAAYAVMSVLSVGLWTALPPAAVEFNRRAYASAINEATQKLDEAYKPLGQSYVEYLDEYNAAMLAFHKAYDETASSYRADAKPVIRVRDNSGLFKWDASIFSHNVIVSENRLLSRKDLGYLNAKGIDSLLILVQDRNAAATQKLQEASSTLTVSCRNMGVFQMSYTLNCPEQIKASATEFNVEVVVQSVSYKNVLPKHIHEEDNFVSVTLRDGEFYLSNKSESYINIDSISFYHNGKIATSSNLGRELAPLSEVKLMSLDRLSIDRDAIAFDNMTKTKALNTKLTYGIALKYKVTNTNKENTLFKTREYRLYDLI